MPQTKTASNYLTYIEILEKTRLYVLLEWPASQLIMDEDWFNECSLAEIKFGKAAYFVPIHRYNQLLHELKEAEK